MRRTKILNADEVRRKPFSEAKNEFVKHCRIKNLRPKTITYYEEDIHYFHMQTKARYVDEITQEKFDDFIIGELDKGKKVTSLNSRIRGLNEIIAEYYDVLTEYITGHNYRIFFQTRVFI